MLFFFIFLIEKTFTQSDWDTLSEKLKDCYPGDGTDCTVIKVLLLIDLILSQICSGAVKKDDSESTLSFHQTSMVPFFQKSTAAPWGACDNGFVCLKGINLDHPGMRIQRVLNKLTTVTLETAVYWVLNNCDRILLVF